MALSTPSSESSLPAYKAGLKSSVQELQVGALKATLIEDWQDWSGCGACFITDLRHNAVFSISLGFVDGDDDPAGRLVAITIIIPEKAPLVFDVKRLGWNKAQPNLTSILPADLVIALRHHDVVGMSHEAFQTHYDYLLPWGLRVKNIVDAKLFLQCTAQPTDEDEGAARRTYELPKKPTKLTLPDALDYWAKTALTPFAACLERMDCLAEAGTLEELGKLLVDPASFTVALLDPYALDQESGPNSWRLRFHLEQYRNRVFARELLLAPPPPAVREEDAGPSAQSSGDEEEASSPQPSLPEPTSSGDKAEAWLPLPETQNDKQDLQETNQDQPSSSTGTVPKRVLAPSASRGGSAAGPSLGSAIATLSTVPQGSVAATKDIPAVWAQRYRPRGGYQVKSREAAEKDAVFNWKCNWCGWEHRKGIYCPVRSNQKAFRLANPGCRLVLCEYQYCDNRTTHLIAICPVLNSPCYLCGFRGHTPRTGRCGGGKLLALTHLRQDFERMADKGVYTYRRHQDLHYGFYATLNGDVSRLNCAYTDLINMPLLTAYAMIEPTKAASLAARQTKL